MPELPDIVVLARSMQEALRGRRITGVTVNQPKCVNLDPAAYASTLVGGRVAYVRQRGKLLLIGLDNGWGLWLSLGMGGEARLHGPGESPDPGRERVVFRFDDGSQLWLHFWWFGNVHAVPIAELSADPRLAGLGPEPLDEAFTPERLAEMLRGRRGRIKGYLLDQRFIAGIGNVYVQDILWHARLHPLRPANTLDEDDLARLHAAIRHVLQEGIRWGGNHREYDVWGQEGRYHEHLQVGYRTGKPCPACGRLVEEIRVGQTTSYICPVCQPLSRQVSAP
jgi:formamidopyrimidine-DNA glycosylase